MERFAFDLLPAAAVAKAVPRVGMADDVERAEAAWPVGEATSQEEPGRSVLGVTCSQVQRLLWEKLGWAEAGG